MAIKETINTLRKLLHQITNDLDKADNGNKAASQRVRTSTVRLEKVAKLYRKESISFDKKNKGVRKASKKAARPAKPAKKAHAPARKPVKAKGKKMSARPRALSVKRPAKNKSWFDKIF